MKVMIRKCKNESGQGLVEFALILPLFLLLVLGMLEYGWLLNAKITVNSTAKDVARTMVVAKGTQAEKMANAEAIASSMLGSSYTLSLPPSLPASGEHLVVVVSDQVKPLVGLYVTGEQTIVGSATMRME